LDEEPFTLVVDAETDRSGVPAPRRFRIGSRTIEAAEILDRWPGHDHTYVKLRGSDGAVYILRQDTARGSWQLILFDRRRDGEEGTAAS
jgi:hypothetical protein